MNWMAVLLTGTFAVYGGMAAGQTASEQVIREGSFELAVSANQALQFFTPEGERTWVKGWNPHPVYPSQAGVAFVANSVFRVDEAEEHSLWTIIEADLKQRVAEYVYVVEGERLSRVRVQVESLGAQHCRVHVHYVHTAISDKGRQFVRTVTGQAYAQKMEAWHSTLSAVIEKEN